MGHFLDRVERGTVPDGLTDSTKKRKVRTMQDVQEDNKREGITEKALTGNKVAPATIARSGMKQIFRNPFSGDGREDLQKARSAMKSVLDNATVKREQMPEDIYGQGAMKETRWSGTTYGYDTNNNGRLDTFEVNAGSNPFNHIYYTSAKPAATAIKDSLTAGAHAVNSGAYSLAAGVGDYFYNLARVGKAAIEQKNPTAKVELKTPLGDSKPMQYIKNNSTAAAERASESVAYFGEVGKFADSIVQSAAQMAPSLVAAYLTGGGSTVSDLSRASVGMFGKAAQMLKLPKHMVPTFVSQAGQSYNNALEQTGNPTKALEFGIVNGYLNALIEQGGVQEGVVSSTMRNSTKRGAWDFAKDNMLSEGTEEITQNWVEGALRKTMIDRNTPTVSLEDENAVINPKRDAYAGAVGAIAGGLFAGANRTTDSIVRKISAPTERAQTGEGSRSTMYNNRQEQINKWRQAETNAQSTVDNAAQQQSTGTAETNGTRGGIKVGEVTTIYSPYKGETPVQSEAQANNTISVSEEAVNRAKNATEQARNNRDGVSTRSALRKIYEQWFDASGGTKHIPVKNTTFGNENYVVDVNKNAVGKLISDPHLSVEKLSLLDNLEDVIGNGRYVGSGNYEQKGKKVKDTIRFDYFETPVTINGKNYIAAFDVEVFPNTNQYRTHKVIEKMDLIEFPSADTGPVPAANGNTSSPMDSISQNGENVNANFRNAFTVDNNTDQQYNNSENGGVANGEQTEVRGDNVGGHRGISPDGQIQQDVQQGQQIRNDNNKSADSARIQQPSDTGGVQLLSERTQTALQNRNVEPVIMRSANNGEEFHAAISQAKQTNPHGAYVTAYDAADYGNMKTFLSDNGKTGIAVKSDGDIVSVFNAPDSGKRGALKTLLPLAIENSGVKLDNYDGNLSSFYEQYGFEPVAKVKFDPEYAPEDWNYERDGQPDIIFWKHNGDSADTVAENIGNYPMHDLSEVPYFDSYDEAAAYRDSLIEQSNNTADSDTGSASFMGENAQETSLTKEEEGAILRYKGGSSYIFNDSLRAGTATQEQEQHKQSLNEALQKMPRYEGKVYRNIGFMNKDKFNSFVLENSGDMTTYAAFTSSSTSPEGYVVETPYQVHMEIQSYHGRDLTGIGTDTESEVLFPTNTTFKIKRSWRDGNIFNMILEEMADNGNSNGNDGGTDVGSYGSVATDGIGSEGMEPPARLDTVQRGSGGTAGVFERTSQSDIRGDSFGVAENRGGSGRETRDTAHDTGQHVSGSTLLNENADRWGGGRERAEKIAEAIGRKLEWYNDQSDKEHANKNGYYKDGVIHINENAELPVLVVLGHETFHSLNAKDKAAIVNFIKKNTNTNNAEFQRYKEVMRRTYAEEYRKKGRLFSDWDFWEEYSAEQMENFFRDETFVNRLAKTNKGTVQRILDTLRQLWRQVREFFSPTDYTSGMNEAGQVSGMTDEQFKRIERMFEKALGHEMDSGVEGKSSIIKRNGEYIVNVDRDIFHGAQDKDYAKILKQWLKENLSGVEIRSLIDNDTAILQNKGIRELAYGKNSQELNELRTVKNQISSHVDEVSRIAQTKETASDMVLKNGKNKHGNFAQNGWSYKEFLFTVGGKVYSGTLNVAHNQSGNYIYDITKIKEVSTNETSAEQDVSQRNFPHKDGAHIGVDTSFTNTISQNELSVNSSISGNVQNDTEKSSIKTSKFYDSTQNTDNLMQETKDAIAEREEAFRYEGISNKETIQRAMDHFKKDPSKTATRFFAKAPGQANVNDIATGFILLQNYQKTGDYESAVEVAKKLREIGTKKGQEVQAFSILQRLTPEGMVYYAQSELDSAAEIAAEKKGRDWMEKNKDKFRLSNEEVQSILDTMKRARSMEDGRQKDILLAEVQKLMQDKMPKIFWQAATDNVNTLQRISLLLNPKTTITRNAGGNLVMSVPHLASESIGAAIDKTLSKVTGVRTTTLPNAKNLVKGFQKGAYESFDDFRRGINTRDISDDRFHIGTSPAFRGNNPLSKAVRKLDNITSFALDVGDRPFFEAYFLDSLHGQMKANKVSQPTADMIDIAMQSALEKTWQDSNKFTEFASSLKRTLNFGQPFGLGSIVIPFTKTPANLAKALVDFSPVGFTKGLVVDGTRLIQAQKRETLTPQMQRKFVNTVSKGIMGMILYAVAATLASKGRITGSDKEDDKDARAFKRNVLGINPYAIKGGNGSWTYDWAQPVGGIMAISADIAENNLNKESAVNVIANALATGGNSLFEQSLLAGVSEFFAEADEGVLNALKGAGMDAPSQFIPTLFKQIAELVDPTKRNTYDPNQLKQAVNQGVARLPWMTKTLEPSVDVLGRNVQRYGGKNNIFNVFLNPGNVNMANPTPELQEVWNVFEDTQDTGVFPTVVSKAITYNGIRYVLSAKERTEYQRILGEETNNGLKELMASEGYKDASAVDKADYIKTIIANGDNKARKNLLAKKGVTDSIANFKNDIASKNKYYSIWDKVEPDNAEKQARGKAIEQVSSVVNALSKKSKLTPQVIAGITSYVDEVEKRSPNAVDKELIRLGALKEENADTENGDIDVATGYMSMFSFTEKGQKYAINVRYEDMPAIMREIENETYQQMQKLMNNQYQSRKKKTYGQVYKYTGANADQKIKWVNEVRNDVKTAFKEKYKKKYGTSKVPNRLKAVK